MTDFSQCVECRQRLHNAFFCQECGAASCSWRCFDQHRARHRAESPNEIPAEPAEENSGKQLAL